jgi:hypothetical protein
MTDKTDTTQTPQPNTQARLRACVRACHVRLSQRRQASGLVVRPHVIIRLGWHSSPLTWKASQGKVPRGRQASKQAGKTGQGRSDELAPSSKANGGSKKAFADACAGGEAHAHGLMLSVDKAHAPGLAWLAHALAPGSADPQGQAVTDGR